MLADINTVWYYIVSTHWGKTVVINECFNSVSWILCCLIESLCSVAVPSKCEWADEWRVIELLAICTITLCILTPSGTDIYLHSGTNIFNIIDCSFKCVHFCGLFKVLLTQISHTFHISEGDTGQQEAARQVHENLPLFGCKNPQLKVIL